MRSSAATAASRLGAARALPGQEALEHEPTGGQPARHQRGDHRRRARAPPRPCTRRRPPPAPAARRGRRCRACRRRSPPPPARRPRIRRSTSAMARTSVWSLTVRSAGAPDAGVLEQAAGPPGVLAADERRTGQRLDRPRRQVAEVADRRADEHERARRPSAAQRSTTRRCPGTSPQRANAPASASITAVACEPRRGDPAGAQRADGPHDELVGPVRRAERDVDREAHAEGVHGPADRQQERAVHAVPPQQPVAARRGGRPRSRGWPAPRRPAATSRGPVTGPGVGAHAPWRISRTSPSTTS